ncbi:MAG TPA: oxidoreductase [Thermotogae bacterium]|nr:oxidoreductase [Thermotogota bacterium]
MSALIVTLLSLSGITTLLAVLLVLADRIINNYGEVEVNINEGKKKLKVKGGSPLLFILAENKIFVPSACGGRGSCGMCKVKVLSDVGPILPTEEPYLSPDEKKEGVRLSCQVKAKKDISIELPEWLFAVSKFKAVVERITELTYDIRELRLRLLDPLSIEFKAGQYVQLIIPPYDQVKESVMRAYSISSPPSQKDAIELIIRKVPGGIATTYIFEHMKEGEEIEFVGPFGEFYLRPTSARVIAIAGGSGMAPIKSIIMDMYEKGIEREIYFFFGARSKADLFYLDFYDELQKKYPYLHFIPALSDPKPEDEWEGEVGLVTDVAEKYLKSLPPSDQEGYLCGSPGMINACVKLLTRYGISEDRIYYDKFA